jgi:CDP-4-dehydro-6-deoxyglucose reductase, E1
MISLVHETIDHDDIDQLIEWLQTYPRLTKGPITLDFESEWAKYIGTRHAINVNSGSSAILLVLSALIQLGRLHRNDNIIVPAVSWATDVSTSFQLGLNPILCDVNLNDLSVDIDELEKLFDIHRPKVFILVHVLGFMSDLTSIKSLCKSYGVILLEDACESIGSTFQHKLAGSFGDVSVFSFYFGHHMSTVEGGMINTDDDDICNMCKSIRNHGWDRDWPTDIKSRMRSEYNVDEFNAYYTFYYDGFNLRGTDLQSFIGRNQLNKVNTYIERRNSNYTRYLSEVRDCYWKPTIRDDVFVSNFAYPIITKNRDRLVRALRESNVECRPLICGSVGRQPFYIQHRGICELKNADIVHHHGMYVPNHPHLESDDITQIIKIINDNA